MTTKKINIFVLVLLVFVVVFAFVYPPLSGYDEFANLMEFIRRENIRAFVTASNVSEVYGLWLKPKKFHF